MKTRNLLWVLFILFILESCNRAMSPYEAANHPRGKKCRVIK
ncbi:MAG: hypothetical protein WAT34_09915 [Chitinophagaceae bacterium]